MKTIIQRNREEKEKFRVPHRVQDVIPVRAVYSDGLFLVGKDRFSKTFQFQDINYAVASQEDQRSMFMAYCSLLNSLDNNATVKITIHNRHMNLTAVRQDGWIPLRNDKLDHYRSEYNQMLTAQISGEDAYCQDKYVTVAVSRSLTDARSYFSRVGSDLITQFSRLGSHCEALGAEQRLKILGGILREDTGEQYSFCLKESQSRGHSFLDPGNCDGQSGYGQKKLDGIVDEVIRQQLNQLKACSKADLLSQRHQKELSLSQAKCMVAEKALQRSQQDVDDLRHETLKVIRGTSKFSQELLSSLLDEATEKAQEAQAQLETFQKEYHSLLESSSGLEQEYHQILSWADLYDHCPIAKKKMIVSQLIKAVYVRRDYEITVEFNISLDDFHTLEYHEKAAP